MDARTEYYEPDAKEMTELLLRVMDGVNAQSFRRWGNKVMTGPFTGMIVPERAPWADGNASTKLIGCYEHELHEVIETALWRQPAVVVNVGCAEGYYAVGFARKDLEVYGYDVSPGSLIVCQEYAEKNNVQVILEKGIKEPETLPSFNKHTLYFMDCEGDEDTLVDLDRCPSLVNGDVIVECHDFLKPGVGSRVADRLARTHRVDLIRPKLPDLRFLEKLPTAMGVLAVVEKRPMPCCWLACWANSKGASNG